eukprot:TRINITY_DN4176_c0_g1_i1.p1 TRINITY_DN4176_c0_g1~~TRINITY_DN4176_c0_g1_i1.p1  ORF type:complete len:401 (-),score=85.24 TRINITY_DN4176_c0_g1_i1:79-1281(-)
MADEEDLLWDAVAEAIRPLKHFETEWTFEKLTKRIRDYFKKAAKGLDYENKTWLSLLDDYCDNAFSALFQSLGDRKWLGEVEFIFVVDAGVKECFPSKLIPHIPQIQFEQAVLASHDRAFEEQRYLPGLWDLLEDFGLAGKTRKKVHDAVEEGRKIAVKYTTQSGDPNEAKNFLSRWADATVQHLYKSTHGYPEEALSETQASRLFHGLIQIDALPIALVAELGKPPERWPFVEFAMRTAYAVHSHQEYARKDKGKSKGRGKSGKPGMGKGSSSKTDSGGGEYGDHGDGSAGRGDGYGGVVSDGGHAAASNHAGGGNGGCNGAGPKGVEGFLTRAQPSWMPKPIEPKQEIDDVAERQYWRQDDVAERQNWRQDDVAERQNWRQDWNQNYNSRDWKRARHW